MIVQPEEDPRGDLIVIGGGCYGSFHARQLEKARSKGVIEARDIVIVDRNPGCTAFREFEGMAGFRFVTSSWDDFNDLYFGARTPHTADRIVPTPLAPHLVCSWLMRRARRARLAAIVETIAPDGLPGTPYKKSSPDGSGYLSFATWVCPVTCIEPAVCPKTRGPKDWEMDDAVFSDSRLKSRGRPYDLAFVFRCRHYAWGVGTYPASLAVRAGNRLENRLRNLPAGRDLHVLVGTVSSCHGVLNVFKVGGVAA